MVVVRVLLDREHLNRETLHGQGVGDYSLMIARIYEVRRVKSMTRRYKFRISTMKISILGL